MNSVSHRAKAYAAASALLAAAFLEELPEEKLPLLDKALAGGREAIDRFLETEQDTLAKAIQSLT